MPFLPALAAIVSIAATGTGLGLELSNQPSTPKATTTPAGVSALQTQQTQNAERAAVSQQLPNLLASTSGLANPEYLQSMVQLLAGTAGQAGSTGAAKNAIAQAFGLPAGALPAGTQGTSATNFTPAGTSSSPNPSAAPVNLSDFAERFLYS